VLAKRGGRKGRALAWLALLALACGRSERPGPAELRFNLETEPPSLDWSLATDGVSVLAIEQLMRGLTRLGRDLRPEPELARSWEISTDGRTYRFLLRDDVRWSDGVPLVAQHFVDGWLRLLAPETAAEYAYFLFPVKNARSTRVRSPIPARSECARAATACSRWSSRRRSSTSRRS
jgi:ABC-type oligopeptide transport system substrate-binding subunit